MSGGAVAGAAAVVVLVVVLAVTLSGGSSAHHRHTPPPQTKASSHPAPAPTTSLPAALQPTTSGTTSATYTTPATYTVELAASQACWVDAVDTTTGRTIWTGTMQGGQTEQLPGPDPMRVVLGASDVALTVDGVPVVLPAGYQVPITLSFQPG